MTTPVPTDHEDSMSDQEHVLLEAELNGDAMRLLLQSKTRIDTGRWLRKSRIWLCLTDTHMLLLAASKRRYVQRMPLEACRDTQYCHTSGALLLEPSDHWRFNTIALAPTDGLKVLQHLQGTTKTSKPPVTEPTGA